MYVTHVVTILVEADHYSVARLAVRTMILPTSCYATAAIMDIMAIALTHQFEQFLRTTGTVHDVSWAPASLVLKTGVFTL